MISHQAFRDPAGIRTQDPYIKSVMLYQLSYEIDFLVRRSEPLIPFPVLPRPLVRSSKLTVWLF